MTHSGHRCQRPAVIKALTDLRIDMMGDRDPKQDVYTYLKLATIGSAAQKWRERYARQGKDYLAPQRACAHRVSQILGEMKIRFSGGNYEQAH